MAITRFEDLEVWQEATLLAVEDICRLEKR
jgi:hypothetical protein